MHAVQRGAPWARWWAPRDRKVGQRVGEGAGRRSAGPAAAEVGRVWLSQPASPRPAAASWSVCELLYPVTVVVKWPRLLPAGW